MDLRLSVIAKLGIDGVEAELFPPLDASKRLDLGLLGATMHDLGHEHLHFLKVDAGRLGEAIFAGWNVKSPSICQIVIRFSLPLAHEIVQSRSFEALGKIGYTFVKCVGTFGDEKCLFVSAQNCR